MMTRRLATIACFMLAAASVRPLAHHSFTAEFDANKPIKLTGTVTKFEWVNPHSWFYVDVTNADGTVTNWGFEMPGPAQLLRLGMKRDSLKAGDLVTVDARLARDGSNHANAQIILMTGTGKAIFGAPQ